MQKLKKASIHLLICFYLFFFSFQVGAYATEYYVAPKGNQALNATDHGLSSWNDAFNIETPCSAGTAMAHAIAGDIVYFRGGTYELGQSNNNIKGSGVLRPNNSGISGSPIIFMAYPGETPHMRTWVYPTYRPDAFISRAFGNGGESYITFDGFTISSWGTDGSNGYASVGVGGDDGSGGVYNIIVKNCIFIGADSPISQGDNISGIAFEGHSYDSLVLNCKFTNYREAGNNHNCSAIKMYETVDLLVDRCEFYNNTVAIFNKNCTTDSIFSNNFIYDSYIGILTTANSCNMPNGKIYNNIIVNSSYQGIAFEYGVVNLTMSNWVIANNTLYNDGSSKRMLFVQMGVDRWVYNNLFYGNASEGAIRVHQKTGYVTEITECDHNLFNDGNFKIDFNGAIYTSLDSWQVSGVLADGNNPGAGSLNSEPLFVNTSGTMREIGDFALASDSPGKSTGRSGVYIGADVSLVGVGAEKPATPRDFMRGSVVQ